MLFSCKNYDVSRDSIRLVNTLSSSSIESVIVTLSLWHDDLALCWDDIYGWMSRQVHATPVYPCHTSLSSPHLWRQTPTVRHVSLGISPFCFLFKSVFVSPISTKTLTIKKSKHSQYNSSRFEIERARRIDNECRQFESKI